MIVGVALAALTAIGGGIDSVSPSYVDDVNFESSVEPRFAVEDDVREEVSTYIEVYDMPWSNAYTWYLNEDNRHYALLDASEKFEEIYRGYSFEDETVTVWVSSPVKSGGVVNLLEDYDVEAVVKVLPGDTDVNAAAYSFMSRFGSADYYQAQPDSTGDGMVVYSASEEHAENGPATFGTIINGVPIEYRYSE